MQSKSNENWKVGTHYLCAKTALNVAASRLYCGMFQAVLAWAREKRGYSGKKGVHEFMERLVLTEGDKRAAYGPAFAELRSHRETADYTPETPSFDELREVYSTCDEMRLYYLRLAMEK